MTGWRPGWREAAILLPLAWLALFFLVPFLIVLKISLAEPILAQPPYSPLLVWPEGGGWPALGARLDNYLVVLQDDLYVRSLLNALRIAAVSTVVMLLIAYPMAYAMARAPRNWRPALLLAVILPFWTSFLIRVYAWIGILKDEGFLNHALISVGLIDQPLVIMNTDWAVHIGIVYSYLPFMILPLYATLERLDLTLIEAAADLGAPPWKSFLQVTLPLSLPGIVAGSLLVFIPAVGEFVIPDLLGGSDTIMIGKTVWIEFFQNADWPLASAIAVTMLVVLVAPLALLRRGLHG
jgi:putrescine transport system permease protein